MSITETANVAWAQLVSITDLDSAPVPICKDKFTIGRAKGCDMSFSTNKLVSGNHCHIERDEDGKVWLCDNSTNGTLLNLSEKVLKQRREITHGDEFYVVYKKNNEELNIGYMFQDLQELEREEDDSNQNYTASLDATLLDVDANEVSDSEVETRKRSQPTERSESPAPVIKRRKTDEGIVTGSGAGTSEGGDSNHGNKEATNQESTDVEKVKEVKPTEETAKAEKDQTKDEVKESKKSDKEEESRDEIAETLICIICQEILHDCISLQPCLHSYCAGCYSDWMKQSNECPSCRMKVERVNKNHMVNNLVEAYLKEHPDKKRPEEDIKELEAKNKITRDMLYPDQARGRNPRHSTDSDPNSSDESLSLDESAEDPFVTGYGGGNPAATGTLFGLGTPFFGTVQAARVMCRQCPGYVDTTTQSGDAAPSCGNPAPNVGEATAGLSSGEPAASTSADQPSTSGAASSNQNSDDIKTMPTAPPFHCVANQNHVLCACCLQPMPDRRHEHQNNPNVPPMSCLMCFRNYCHAYWGCRKADCLGCFSKFEDMNMGKKSLANLVLDNAYESQILADYLEANSISVKEVLKTCLQKMARGEYVCRDQSQFRYNLTSQTWLCYCCALRNFKDLAYYYRREIPRDKLPDAVTSRPDCYWGKNCRTQRNKPHHAQRFNHICDQSRTT